MKTVKLASHTIQKTTIKLMLLQMEQSLFKKRSVVLMAHKLKHTQQEKFFKQDTPTAALDTKL